MMGLIDILAKKSDGEAIVLVVFIVIVGVLVAVVSAAQKRKQAQGTTRRRAPLPHAVQAPVYHAPVPPPPQVDSASHTSVARQLAPEMMTMANARNLTPTVEKVAAAKFSLITLLKDKRDVRRALILTEVLSKPVSMRRR